MTAISDRALAYTDTDLEHRFLVVYEAAGMVGEFASYLTRSLPSEGRHLPTRTITPVHCVWSGPFGRSAA